MDNTGLNAVSRNSLKTLKFNSLPLKRGKNSGSERCNAFSQTMKVANRNEDKPTFEGLVPLSPAPIYFQITLG